MSYTIKNLRDVKDMAPDFGYEEQQEARFARQTLDAEDTGLALLRVKPGQRSGFAHKHENAEEIYVIIRGSGRIKLDDEILDVSELDAIRIAPGVARALEAGDEGIEFLAFGPHHDKDGEILSGDFWGV